MMMITDHTASTTTWEDDMAIAERYTGSSVRRRKTPGSSLVEQLHRDVRLPGWCMRRSAQPLSPCAIRSVTQRRQGSAGCAGPLYG